MQRFAAAGAVRQGEPDASDESRQAEKLADETFAPAVEEGDGQYEPDDDIEDIHGVRVGVIFYKGSDYFRFGGNAVAAGARKCRTLIRCDK